VMGETDLAVFNNPVDADLDSEAQPA
jgi:hypothetical protein